MAKTAPGDRHTIDNRLLALFADLKSAKIDYREACLLLAQSPDDDERKRVVAVLEAEIAQHEQAIERLDAAKLAQAESSSQQAEDARIQAAKNAAQAAASTAPKIRAVLERLVDAFELTVGPALAEFESLQREYTAQAWAAASGAMGGEAARRGLSTFSRLSSDGPATAALLAAVIRSGVGQVGPRLTPWISVSAPFQGVGSPDNALESFDKQAKSMDAYLAEAIQRAINPVTSEEEL